jgi:hypothetical protein
MKNDYQTQYLKNLLMIFNRWKEGQLINLTLIYDSYGRPKNKSPRRVIKNKWCTDIIWNELRNAGYNNENVIKYVDNHFLTNAKIAIAYMQFIDQKSYVRAMLRLDKEDSLAAFLHADINNMQNADMV